MKVHGSCHCGAIRFEAEADPQKAGVFLQGPKDAFRLTAGQPKIYVKTADSGNRRAQAFCATCGSRLWASAEKDPPVYNLRIGTLRERAELPPRSQVWCRSALPWVSELGRVPGKAQGA